MKKIAHALAQRENAVIVVAEGYKTAERKKSGFRGNAADFFHRELVSAGLKTDRRVICEPFSRDTRGAAPNNLDLMLAQRMARTLLQLIQSGETKKMPAVLSGKDYSIPFNEIRTDNSVQSALASLANRLLS
jgi:6-phosphofructokinase